MNERIKELVKQATTEEHDGFLYFDKQKFAKLIVRECARVAKTTEADDGDDYKSGRQWAGIEILKHFNVGVEE